MSKENGGSSQSEGSGFRTMVSVAALIAAGAAIYYASSVDATDRINELEGTIKSLTAKLEERPTADGVKQLISENVKIPAPGTTVEQVKAIMSEPLTDIRLAIDGLPNKAEVRSVADEAASAADQTLIEQQLPGLIAANSVPKGAVVAFATSCPVHLGWKEHEAARGRFLVATGQHNDKNGASRNFVLGIGVDDGEYEHTLTVEEMPGHRHAVDRQGPTRGIEGLPPIGSDGAVIATIEQEMTLSEGGSKAHNTVPPYIALHFCEKT